MQTNTEHTFIWTWNNKRLPITELHYGQLLHIKSYVSKKQGVYYGKSSDEWINCITELMKKSSQERPEAIGIPRRVKIINKVDNLFKVLFPKQLNNNYYRNGTRQ